MSDILERLSAHRLVPVVVLDDAADADALAAALVDGGLPVAEVTFRTAAAAEAIEAMAARGDVLVGAGTVLTPAQVDEAVAAGAPLRRLARLRAARSSSAARSTACPSCPARSRPPRSRRRSSWA